MIASATMTVDWACETLSMVWPTTTYWPPAAAPVMRTSALLIATVRGALTVRYAAGRTALEVLQVTLPSGWMVHTMTGGPNGRSGGGAPKPAVWGGGSRPICESDMASRPSICAVRVRVTISTTAAATTRYATPTTAAAEKATRIEVARTSWPRRPSWRPRRVHVCSRR